MQDLHFNAIIFLSNIDNCETQDIVSFLVQIVYRQPWTRSRLALNAMVHNAPTIRCVMYQRSKNSPLCLYSNLAQEIILKESFAIIYLLRNKERGDYHDSCRKGRYY